MALVRDEITYQEIPCEANKGNQALEGVSIKVKTGQEPVIITNLYYPLQGHTELAHRNKDLHLQPKTNRVIVGDLNAHHQLWDKILKMIEVMQ